MAEEVDYDEDYTEARVKGRGHGSAHMYGEERYEGRGGVFERIGRDGDRRGPIQCKSYILFNALYSV